jgi:hypothetical protein
MRIKPILTEGGEAAWALLRLTHAAADVFPPLKGAVGGALHIIDIVKVQVLQLEIDRTRANCQ